jgi:uncharacterized protein YybS (DUF2232 family)
VNRAPATALPTFATCLAAALGLFLAGGLPYAGGLSLLTPLPVAFCYHRGRLPGLAVALAGALAVSLPAGDESRTVALIFLALAAGGVVLGELLRRGFGPEATLSLGLPGMLLVSGAVFLAHAAVEGQPPGVLAQAYTDQTLAEVRQNLTELGYGSPQEIETTLRGLLRLLPAVLSIMAGAIFALNLAVARRFFPALGEKLAEWPSFRLWRTPEPLVWVLIAAGLLIVVNLGPARLVGLNVLAVAAVLYFVQGLGIAAFYLEKKHVPRPLRLVVYAVLLIEQHLSLAVAAIGLFDLWVDFRRLKQSAVKEAES